MPENAPVLNISVELGQALWTAAAAALPRLREEISQRMNRIMATLGVPGTASVELLPHDGANVLSIRSGRELCRYPEVLLDRAHAYVANASVPLASVEMRDWLGNAFRDRAKDAIDVVADACEGILELQPEVLVQDEQAAAYAERLEAALGTNPAFASATVKKVLRALAASRCSSADVRRIGEGIVNHSASDEEMIERIVSEASHNDIEIRVASDLYDSLLQAGDESKHTELLRDGLYDELGILLGEVRLAVDADLRAGGVRYRINALETVPFLCVGAQQLLANDTADQLRLLGVTAIATLSVDGSPAAVVDVEHRTVLEAAGLTLWDQWELVILGLAHVIRRNAACFCRVDVTEMQLQKLARDYPKLVEVTRSGYSVEYIAAVLRALAAEQVAVRDLRLILERLVDRRYNSDPLSEHALLDARFAKAHADATTIPATVEFVRAGLQRQLAHKLARGTQTMVAYLLADDLERLAAADHSDADARVAAEAAIINAVHAEMAHLPPTAQVPVLLTDTRTRLHLRRILHLTFPALSYVSFAELPGDLNVQPVARIGS